MKFRAGNMGKSKESKVGRGINFGEKGHFSSFFLAGIINSRTPPHNNKIASGSWRMT